MHESISGLGCLFSFIKVEIHMGQHKIQKCTCFLYIDYYCKLAKLLVVSKNLSVDALD